MYTTSIQRGVTRSLSLQGSAWWLAGSAKTWSFLKMLYSSALITGQIVIGYLSLDDVSSRGARGCQSLEVRMGMPDCYNGELDSHNHRDHVTASRRHGGRCPSSHPKRLPQLFFEFVYDWEKSIAEKPGSTFIFADGTKKQHADFLNGWDVSTLRRVMNECHGLKKNIYDGTCTDRMSFLTRSSGGCTLDGQNIVQEEIQEVSTLPGPQGNTGDGKSR